MRSRKILTNTMVGLISSAVTAILSFWLNKVFLTSLGLEYLGLNGIFANALGMLSLTELGIGLAISYELYEPLARGDEKKIAALMRLYRKVYYLITGITLAIGMCVGVFVCATVNTSVIPFPERILYFMLFLANNCCTYLLAYKRTLLEADQKSYVISSINTGVTIVATLLKITVLYYFSSYTGYILLMILQTLGVNWIANRYINRHYTYLRQYKEKIDNESYLHLLHEVKSRIVIKVCNVLVSSTDNIIIGSIINVSAAGLFQNYSLLVGQMNIFINQIGNAITPSLGNVVAVESKDRLKDIVKEIEFLNHCIGAFCFVVFYTLVSPFIRLWLGEYILPFSVPLLLMVDLYITMIRDVHWKVNNMALGFKGNRRIWFHIGRSALNLLVSLVGAYWLGVTGVVLGTVVSSFLVWLGELVYTYVFVLPSSVCEYFKRQSVYFVQLVLLFLSVNFVVTNVNAPSLLLNFVLKGMVSVLMTMAGLVILNIRNENLGNILGRMLGIIHVNKK